MYMYDIFDNNSFRLVTRAKPVGWPGVKWTAVDDSRLLVGVYKHGLGNWDNIKDDSESGLSNKVCFDFYNYLKYDILLYCYNYLHCST